VTDNNDERSAREVIERACPDEGVRKVALSILAEAIKEANVYGRDKWTVGVAETARLVVGNYYVCTVRETGVWIALDDRFMKRGDYYPTMDELNSWGWMPDKQGEKGSYSNYKDKSRRTDFSVNGRYSIGVNHNDYWPHIRRLFFDFIYKVIYHGQPMNPNSPALHSQGMLKHMRHYLGVDLPDPLYQPDVR
jgi:hypothetical protein